jgi:hypothetical protein
MLVLESERRTVDFGLARHLAARGWTVAWYCMSGFTGQYAWRSWARGELTGEENGRSEARMQRLLEARGYPLLFLYYEELADELEEHLDRCAMVALEGIPAEAYAIGPLSSEHPVC